MSSLAWTLLHFIWQGAALALALAGAQLVLRNSTARVRYAAACATLLFMFASAVITFTVLERNTAGPVASTAVESVRQSPSSAEQVSNGPNQPAPYVAWLVYAWMLGVAVLSVRSSHAWILAQRMKRKQAWPAASVWQERLKRLQQRLEISRPIRLCESAIAEVPAVIGWLRPVILMPAGAVTGLAPLQLEALLAHELAHVRRHDYVVNLMQTVVETLLFYHPAVWWVGKRIRAERENCCDDLAVSVCGDVLTYARALTRLEQMRTGTPEFAMAANAGSLVERIRRLLAPKLISPKLGAPKDARHTVAPDWITPTAVLLSAIGIWAASGIESFYHHKAQLAAFRLPDAIAAQGLRVGPIEISQAVPVTEVETEPPQIPTAAGLAQPERAETPEPQPAPPPDPDPPQPPPPPPAATRPGGYIGALAEAGYAGLSVDQLIAFKTHGVTPEYARAMQAAGLKPTPDQLVAMSIHGVTPGFVNQMKSAGFSNLTVDQLVALSIHGVRPDFVNQVKSAGYPNITIDQLLALRIHGAAPDYVTQIKDLGLGAPTVDQLIAMLIQGVTPDYVQQMKTAGVHDLSFDRLIAMRIHGLEPADVREAQKHFKDFSIDQLLKLKQLGILSVSNTI